MWEVQKGAMIETPDLKQSTSNLWKTTSLCLSMRLILFGDEDRTRAAISQCIDENFVGQHLGSGSGTKGPSNRAYYGLQIVGIWV